MGLQQHKMLTISSVNVLCQYRRLNSVRKESHLNLTCHLLFFYPLPFLLQILELVKGMHYQLACQKYFELTHNVSADLI